VPALPTGAGRIVNYKANRRNLQPFICANKSVFSVRFFAPF